jgi:hypothetical protein
MKPDKALGCKVFHDQEFWSRTIRKEQFARVFPAEASQNKALTSVGCSLLAGCGKPMARS